MQLMKRQPLFSRMVPLVITMLALSGCTLNTDLSGPATIQIVSGDGQTQPVNMALPSALTVIVVGSFFEPIPNETVTWSIVAPGGGSLNPLTSVTDQNGVASTSYTTGAAAGAVKVQAKVNALPAVFFDVTVTP
jgi:Bacterial Ig-like domain (group 1)